MDYQEYLQELAEKYSTTPEVIERAQNAFSGNDDELFAEIAWEIYGEEGGSVSLQDCIEYVAQGGREMNLQIAKTIIEQMAGSTGRMVAMIGARDIVALETGVQFGFRGCRRANKCRIELDANDTYTLQLWKYTRRTGDCDLVHEAVYVYADMLKPIFEHETGLYLTI